MAKRLSGSYGIDAPWVPVMWVGMAAVAFAVATAFGAWQAAWWTEALRWYFFVSTAAYLIGAALYWHASLRGKFVLWQRVLDRVPSAGVRRSLDLGCGRGAVAVMTALRFPDASVTGIDLWRTIDQSGNSEVAARTNAAANRVQSRLALVTGDMISLPFEDGAFDLVTAGLSIHNIPAVEGRTAALREGVRVLAEGGQLIIIDIRRAPEYAQQLRELGLDVSGPDRLGWRGWWTGPWIASSIVRATK